MYRPVFFNLPDIIYFNFYLSPVGSYSTCYGTFFTLEREYLASSQNCSIEICLKCSFQNWSFLMRLEFLMEITNSYLPIFFIGWHANWLTRPKFNNCNCGLVIFIIETFNWIFPFYTTSYCSYLKGRKTFSILLISCSKVSALTYSFFKIHILL